MAECIWVELVVYGQLLVYFKGPYGGLHVIAGYSINVTGVMAKVAKALLLAGHGVDGVEAAQLQGKFKACGQVFDGDGGAFNRGGQGEVDGAVVVGGAVGQVAVGVKNKALFFQRLVEIETGEAAGGTGAVASKAMAHAGFGHHRGGFFFGDEDLVTGHQLGGVWALLHQGLVVGVGLEGVGGKAVLGGQAVEAIPWFDGDVAVLNVAHCGFLFGLLFSRVAVLVGLIYRAVVLRSM